MEIKKNDVFTLDIEDLGTDGSGIGHIQPDGFTLFVKDALPGDWIRAKVIKRKTNYGYGRLEEILEPSPDRVKPLCPVARQCGGCQIQHLSYEAQLSWKQRSVRSILRRIGGIEDYEMLPIMGMDEPWHYRNKAQFPVAAGRDGRIHIGFYAAHSHNIIDLAESSGMDCVIQNPVNARILSICRGWMQHFHISAYDEKSGKGLVRHILTRVGYATGEIMVCLVINGNKLPHADALIAGLREIPGMTSICINVNRAKNNVILGSSAKTLWGQDYITDSIGEVRYHISALSFYQVNPVQTRRLYAAALDFASPGKDDIVWDLYCGIGTISLFLARSAGQVFGVEIVPEAVGDARANAILNGITNAHFFAGRAEDIAPRAAEILPEAARHDIIVVDPPRKGCEQSLLEFMTKAAPKRIVYVSCNPSTLARDLKVLTAGGYKVRKVQCCDMFAHSCHVETVCLMSRDEG